MLRLTTLGAIDLRDRHGHPVREVLSQPKRVALLAYLALESRRTAVPRDRLLALFWPESDESRARNALSQALHHLRQALGGDLIEGAGSNGLRVRNEALWSDATAFLEAVDGGDLQLAADLYQGEFCPTLFTRGAPELEHWLDQQRSAFKASAIAATRRLAEQKAAGGDRAGAAALVRKALALRPSDEADVRAMIALLAESGDRSSALQAYQQYSRQLASEFEIEPDPETRRLAEAIRQRVIEAAPGPDEKPAPLAPAAAGLPPSQTVNRSRRRVGLAAALTVLLLAGGWAIALKARSHPRPPAGPRALVVFPFTLQGGAPYPYLRDGMVDLLSTKLDGSGLRAVDPRSVLAAVAAEPGGELAPEVKQRIAKEFGAGWYISGEVTEVAGQLQLRGRMVPVSGSGQAVVPATVTGDTADLFQLVDDLAGQLLARVLTGRDSALTRLAAVTTHSLPALRRFLEGEQAQREGHDARAGAAFREAAMLDTTFALAQYRLVMTATWVRVPEVSDLARWAALADRHARRLPPLARDLLSAYRAYRERRSEDAERLYRAVTASHPDNVEAWFMLGETLFHFNIWRGRSPMEGWSAFQRVLALDPGNTHAIVHLARLAALDGRTGELDRLAGRLLARAPGADRAVEIEMLRAAAAGDSTLPESAAGLAATDDYVLVSLLHAALIYGNNLRLARSITRSLQDKRDGSVTFLWRMVADVPLASGQWRGNPPPLPASSDGVAWYHESRAMMAAERGFPISLAEVAALRDTIEASRFAPLRSTLEGDAVNLSLPGRWYWLGLLNARLGAWDQVSRYEAMLQGWGEPDSGMARQLLHGLRAERARSLGNHAEALAELENFQFEAASPGVVALGRWGVRERFLRGELLRELERDEEAASWYSALSGAWDTPYMALAQLRLAEIAGRRGDPERAAFHRSRARSMWSGADPAMRRMVE